MLTRQFALKENIDSLVEVLNKSRLAQSLHTKSKKSFGLKKNVSIPSVSTLSGLVYNESFVIKSRSKHKSSTLPSIKTMKSESFLSCKPSEDNSDDLKDSLSSSVHQTIQVRPRKVRVPKNSSKELSCCLGSEKVQIQTRTMESTYFSERNEEITNGKKDLKKNCSMNEPNSPNDNKIIEDPFYYANIIKSSSFSSFHRILEKKNEMISNPFPYCSRIGKSPKVPKLTKKFSIISNPNLILDCKCKVKFQNPNFHSYDEKFLPFGQSVKRVIPDLIRLHLQPQKVVCFRNLLIINLDSALGSFTSVLYIKSGSWKVLRKLGNTFQLVLIIAGRVKAKEEILKQFEIKKIKVAGIYSVSFPEKASRQAIKLQNYSQVFMDFDCKNTQKSCVIVTSHNLVDDPESTEEFIGKKQGIGVKLNSIRLPVSTKEYPACPYTVLLPNFEVCSKLTLLDRFGADVAVAMASFRPYKDSFEFPEFFQKFKYKGTGSSFSNQILVNSMLRNFSKSNLDAISAGIEKELVVFCTLHRRFYVNYPTAHSYVSYIIDNSGQRTCTP